MLREVKQEAIDEAIRIMRILTRTKGAGEDIEKQVINDHADDIGEYSHTPFWVYCFSLCARFQFSDNGIPERNADGELIFELTKFYGDSLLYFFAFCLQEKELRFVYDNDECESQLYYDVPHLTARKNRFELDEWREYIKDKYHILPPKLDERFYNFINDFCLVTGGITLMGCLDETTISGEELPSFTELGSDRDRPLNSLELSTFVYHNLSLAGIETLGDLIDCYTSGDGMLHIRRFSVKSLEEVESKLAFFDVPKTKQSLPPRKSFRHYHYERTAKR
ncbi:hypothetical protein FACS1894132_02320 [Clostridia bacterium]|nr:hypothetical protein FACS1894132_02320 [Clostridia bacterium]